MSDIPTVWCPYCDSANELNAKRCWHCRQSIPARAERTGVSALPVPMTAVARLPHPLSGYPAMVTGDGAIDASYIVDVDRKQCVYCREWIDPQASVCPCCRTEQGAIAAVQKATWAFVQLFFCFAVLGVGAVVLIRLWQWGMAGAVAPKVAALLGLVF